MIPFLVFKQINVLNIAVDVGFVVGITAAITPSGSATFFIPNEASSSITPQVLSFLYLLYIFCSVVVFYYLILYDTHACFLNSHL